MRPEGLPAAFQGKARKKHAKKTAHLCQNHDFGSILGSPGGTEIDKIRQKRPSKIYVFPDALPNTILKRLGTENRLKKHRKSMKKQVRRPSAGLSKTHAFLEGRAEKKQLKHIFSKKIIERVEP